MGLDVRADQNFDEALSMLESLRNKGFSYEIIFMDASDETLIKRYKETRRMHPMCTMEDNRVENGISKERKILEKIKADSDYIFDTSNLLTRDLKKEIDRIFVNNEDYSGLMINIVSFGFKHGIPRDADLVFDVRFLPNPFYIEELKPLTGNDKEVQDYVLSFSDAQIFLDKLKDMLEFLLPGYVSEGKHQLVVAIGCTGGKHRSVTLANELYNRMKNIDNYGVYLSHRDIP